MSIFGDKTISWTATEIAGLDIEKLTFIKNMLLHTYEKVLFISISDIEGDTKEVDTIMTTASDHYSPRSYGFIHWTAKAMAEKINLVLDKQKQSDGTYIFVRSKNLDKITPDNLVLDFTNYHDTDLLTCYFGMMFDALDAASKGIKTSQGLIVYLEKLYESLADSKAKEIIEGQIKALGDALKGGKTGYASGGSKIEFVKFDIEPTSKAIEFSWSQVAGHLGLPLSAINGVGGSAMSDTGESDRKQIRRSSEFYFNSIIRPILKDIFVDGKAYQLKPELDEMELLTEIVMLAETSEILTNDDKKLLLSQFGLKGNF